MEESASLFSPDYLRPSQFRDLLYRSANGDDAPIRRLMLAILEVSLRDATGVAKSRTKRLKGNPSAELWQWRRVAASKNQRHAAEALDWIFDDGAEGVFSFVNVCDVLGIDSGRLRARVRARLAEKEAIPTQHRKLGSQRGQKAPRRCYRVRGLNARGAALDPRRRATGV